MEKDYLKITENPVDVSKEGCFDELEYDVWELFCKYCNKFGITVDEPEDPDWDMVKPIQDLILDLLEKEGVKFIFELIEEREE